MTAKGPALVRTERAGGLLHLVLAHPPVNVLTIAVMDDLAAAFRSAGEDRSVRVVLLSGEGRCFSAGADVAEHLGERVRDLWRVLHGLVEAMLGVEQPILCAAHGAALGGALEVAALADLLYVAEGCRLGLPEVRLGCIAPVAAAAFPALMLPRQAVRLLLTGEEIAPQEAVASGLATEVLPEEGFAQAVERKAAALLALSAPALRDTKRALGGGARAAAAAGLAAAGRVFLESTMAGRDAAEGLRAFLEKRAPVWEHR